MQHNKNFEDTPVKLLMLRKRFKYRNVHELHKKERPNLISISANDILSNSAINKWPTLAIQSAGLGDFETAYTFCFKYLEALKSAQFKYKAKDKEPEVIEIDIDIETPPTTPTEEESEPVLIQLDIELLSPKSLDDSTKSLDESPKSLDESPKSLDVSPKSENVENEGKSFEYALKRAQLKLNPHIPEQYRIFLECEYAKLQLLERKAKTHPEFVDAYFLTTELTQRLSEIKEEFKQVWKLFEEKQRESYSSGSKMARYDIDDLVPEELKCPICFDVYEDKVFQCRNGHSICGECSTKGGMIRCPECRTLYGMVTVRNRAVESLASGWKTECPYKGNGCREKVKCGEVQEHVKNCQFRDPEIYRLEQRMKWKNEEIGEMEDKLKRAKDRLAELDMMEDSERNLKKNEYQDLTGKYRVKLMDLFKKRAV